MTRFHGFVVTGLVGLALSTSACRGSGPGAAVPPPGTVTLAPLIAEDRLYYDARSAVRDSSTAVLRDPLAWRDTWHAITANRRTAPAAPPIDFSTSMMIVVAAGPVAPDQRLRVDSIAVRPEMSSSGALSDVLMVWYSITGTCGALSSRPDFPVEAVRAETFRGRVRFVRSTPPGRCGGQGSGP